MSEVIQEAPRLSQVEQNDGEGNGLGEEYKAYNQGSFCLDCCFFTDMHSHSFWNFLGYLCCYDCVSHECCWCCAECCTGCGSECGSLCSECGSCCADCGSCFGEGCCGNL